MAAETQNAWWVNGGAGGAASCAAKTLTNPLQRVITLRVLGKPGSFGELARGIVDENRALRHKGTPREMWGPVVKSDYLAFWRGNLVSMFQRFPYSAVQLMVYDKLKFALMGTFDVDMANSASGSAVLCKGAASGVAAAVSGTVVYPLDVVKTRLQSGDAKCTSARDAIWQIYNTHGARGFFRGLSMNLVQRVPEIMINLTVYDTTMNAMVQNGFSKRDGVFAGGTAAALVAILVTFPLELVKKNMQAGESGAKLYATPTECAKDIFKTRGVRGFYRGSHWEAARCVPQVVLMWYLIEFFREKLSAIDKRRRATVNMAARPATF